MAKILIIDDEASLRQLMRDVLEQAGHQVTDAPNGLVGVEHFKGARFDLVITDIIMPDQEGIETILEIRQHAPDQKIIAISGGGRTRNAEFLAVAKKVGADEILAKPFSLADLRRAVSVCLETRTPQ
jgi:DNA-binding response OmpR family regulator